MGFYYKGTTYFTTYSAARAAAKANSLPTSRIIRYGMGWVIQLRVSGPYAGPQELSVESG